MSPAPSRLLKGAPMDTVSRVYALLNERNMSLYQLARLSGVSHSTIKTTEKRGGQLTVDTIERLCEGLGITLYDFFREDAGESATAVRETNATICKEMI